MSCRKSIQQRCNVKSNDEQVHVEYRLCGK